MTINLLHKSDYCLSKAIANPPQPKKHIGSHPSATERKSAFGIKQKLQKPPNHQKQPLRSREKLNNANRGAPFSLTRAAFRF